MFKYLFRQFVHSPDRQKMYLSDVPRFYGDVPLTQSGSGDNISNVAVASTVYWGCLPNCDVNISDRQFQYESKFMPRQWRCHGMFVAALYHCYQDPSLHPTKPDHAVANTRSDMSLTLGFLLCRQAYPSLQILVHVCAKSQQLYHQKSINNQGFVDTAMIN